MTCRDCLAFQPIWLDEQWRRCIALRMDGCCLIKNRSGDIAIAEAAHQAALLDIIGQRAILKVGARTVEMLRNAE